MQRHLLGERRTLETHALVENAARLLQLVAQSAQQRLRRLAPHADALRRAAQPVQLLHRLLARTGSVGELLFRAAAFGEHGLEPLFGGALGKRCRRTPLGCFAEPLVERREIDLGDARAQLGELAAQLLGALRCRCLQRERTQALLHLCLEVARALDLDRDARELELGAVPARLEAAEPGGLLDQRAALLRLRREDRLDLALPDDRVHPLAEAEVGEQLDEVEPPHPGPVQEVLALAPAMEAARDGDLGEIDRQRVIGVVEEELDLAEVGGAAAGRAREENVVRLLRAQLERAERAGRPADGVGDVRLAGAVRPHDDPDALLEANFDRVRERLEAANLDRAQMHRRGPYRACTTALLGVVFRGLAGERGVLVSLEELEDAAPLGLLGVLVEPLVEALVGVLLAGHGVRMPEPGALRGPPPVRRPSSSLPPPRRAARRPRVRRT